MINVDRQSLAEHIRNIRRNIRTAGVAEEMGLAATQTFTSEVLGTILVFGTSMAVRNWLIKEAALNRCHRDSGIAEHFIANVQREGSHVH